MFLQVSEKTDSISIHLIGNDKNHYRYITFQIHEKYKEEPDDIVRLLFKKEIQNAEFISIAKSDLVKFGSNLCCSIQFTNMKLDGIMQTIVQELFIESLDKIPSNNLFYIRNN